jgi:hypothetical protein
MIEGFVAGGGKLALVDDGESLRSSRTATAVIDVTKAAHTTVVRVGPRECCACPVLLKL